MDKRKRTGINHPLYQGGKTISHGYVVLTSDSWGKDKGRYEHRVIMENHLGRPLSDLEIVHHINGNTTDNRLENLEVVSRLEHNRKHGGGRILQCAICGKEKWYSPDLINRLAIGKEGYYCRKCSYTHPKEKTCKKCGNSFMGGMPARFCSNCTEKSRSKKKNHF